LAGQLVAGQAGAGSAGLLRREDPLEEPAGKIQVLRCPELPDREFAHNQQSYEHLEPAWPGRNPGTFEVIPGAIRLKT
jgi:hypothetical protein